MLFNVAEIRIKPEDMYQYFLEHKEELESNMHIIAHTNDLFFADKSFLYITNENGEMLLSLEALGVIVDSEYCSIDNVEETVYDFLKRLDKLVPLKVSNDVYVYNKRYYGKIIDIIKAFINLETIMYDVYLFDNGYGVTGHKRFAICQKTSNNILGLVYLDKNNIITKLKLYKPYTDKEKKLEEELLGYQLICLGDENK